MSNEVKRYDPNYAAMSPADDLAVEAEDGMFVMATDYATLEAENAKLRAELERRAVPVERIKVALEFVQNAMEDSYNNAYQECCGRGHGQCCGDPVPTWSAEDTAIMDALAPAQRELSALLAAAPSAPKADDPVKVQLCKWERDEDTGAYETECGSTWHLTDGGQPEEHGQYFCHHCGKPIDEAEAAHD